MMKQIWVIIKTKNQGRILVKLFKYQINVIEVQYEKDALLIKILENDYKKLKKIVGCNFQKKSSVGIFHVLEILKKRYLIVIGCILFCFFLFLFSNTIVSVEVIHSNKEIRLLVSKALEEYGIRRLTLKKNFQEIEKIKAKILNDYPEKLEWLEIETKGMKYVVRIEERIITKPVEEKKNCHLVATKSAIVKKMFYSVGDAKVMINDFVKEGDILISGEIVANEEMKENVCATGQVYGEVWYTTSVSLPLNYEEKTETGKVRWNFQWSKGSKTELIFRPRLDNYIEEKTTLFTLFGVSFSFVKQKEVVVTPLIYNEEEALEKAMTLVDEKFQLKLLDNEEVINKKVLKKQVNDSTMDVEVFVSVIENISRQEEFQKMEEEG